MKIVIASVALIVALVAGGIQTYRMATVTSFNADESTNSTLTRVYDISRTSRELSPEQIKELQKYVSESTDMLKDFNEGKRAGPRVMTIDY